MKNAFLVSKKTRSKKREDFFWKKSHAGVCGRCETGAVRPYTSTLRAASARPGRLTFCEALVTPYDHSTCLGGTVADKFKLYEVLCCIHLCFIVDIICCVLDC